MNQQIILAVVIGLVAGALFVWLISRGARGDADLAQTKLDKLQKEFDSYRNEVNAHFAQTADAVDQLTQSYENVFNHLSRGAQQLMDKTALKAQLEKRQGKAVTLAYLVDEAGHTAQTAVPAQSVVAQEKTAPAAAALAPAQAAEAAKNSGTLHFPADAQKAAAPQNVQKQDDNGSRVLTYSAQSAENKAGAEKKPEAPIPAAAPLAAEAPKKRSVEIAAENAGLHVSPKAGEIGAGETSLEAVKRHLREQNPPAQS